jgi:hypothetical protein
MAIGAYILINGKVGKIKQVVAALAKVKGVKSVHACWGGAGYLRLRRA